MYPSRQQSKRSATLSDGRSPAAATVGSGWESDGTSGDRPDGHPRETRAPQPMALGLRPSKNRIAEVITEDASAGLAVWTAAVVVVAAVRPRTATAANATVGTGLLARRTGRRRRRRRGWPRLATDPCLHTGVRIEVRTEDPAESGRAIGIGNTVCPFYGGRKRKPAEVGRERGGRTVVPTGPV
jgi:hypothetical protein